MLQIELLSSPGKHHLSHQHMLDAMDHSSDPAPSLQNTLPLGWSLWLRANLTPGGPTSSVTALSQEAAVQVIKGFGDFYHRFYCITGTDKLYIIQGLSLELFWCAFLCLQLMNC